MEECLDALEAHDSVFPAAVGRLGKVNEGESHILDQIVRWSGSSSGRDEGMWLGCGASGIFEFRCHVSIMCLFPVLYTWNRPPIRR